MQRVKGHGNQGGVRNGTDNNEHENVNNWAHQSYNGANPGMAAGPYSVAAYYGAAYYRTYCMGDGTPTWPNSDQVTYVGNYNGQLPPEAAAAYTVDGMYNATPYTNPYSQTTAPNAPSYNYYPGNATEYPAWNAAASMPPVPSKQYDEYYREGMYNGVDALKNVNQRLQNLDIASDSNSNKMADPKFNYGGRSDTYSSSMSASNEKKTISWASIAKQPAKPIPQTSSGSSKKKGPGMPPPPMVPGRNIDLNTWEPKINNVPKVPVAQAPPPSSSVNSLATKPVWNGPMLAPEAPPPEISSPCEPVVNSAPPPPSHSSPPMPIPVPTPSPPQPHKSFSNAPPMNRPPPPAPTATTTMYREQPPMTRAPPITTLSSEVITPSSSLSSSVSSSPPHSVVDKLKDKNNYNPTELELPPVGTRFFVIKSYSEDDVHRSIKYEIWCSTEHGNKRLDDAFADQKSINGAVYLFFSVNGSGHFCGVARMISAVDYGASSSVWAQDKWKGQFRVRWIYVKDVPNSQLRHIRLENNENKPVTNSRDTQEVPYDKGVSVLKTIHVFSHTTSIFDDFTHYEKRQEEGDHNKRGPIAHQGPPMHHNHSASQHRNNPFDNNRSRQDKDRDGGGNNYSQMNFRRGGMRNNGNGFNNQRSNSNALYS